MGGELLWRGQVMRDRAMQRRERLLRAGFELLGTDGAEATTMRAVCRAAGLSQKYFYESFPDREHLLLAVYNRVIDGLRAGVESTPVHPDHRERWHATFEAAARYFEEDPRRGRIVFRETLGNDTLRHNGLQAIIDFMLFTTRHLKLDEILDIDDRQLPLHLSSLGGGVVMVYLNWLDGLITASRSEIADHCTHLVMSTLPVWHAPGLPTDADGHASIRGGSASAQRR